MSRQPNMLRNNNEKNYFMAQNMHKYLFWGYTKMFRAYF